MDKNLYALPAREARRIRHLPKTLDEALDALERDHAFLLKGGVFTEDLLEEWIRLKREEAAQVRLRPSPMEHYLILRPLGGVRPGVGRGSHPS